MSKERYQYAFGKTAPILEVGESLLLATIAAESIHGQVGVKLDSFFKFDIQARTCVIDSSTDVGRSIARIFTGFITLEFGEDAFKVERITDNQNTN